MISVELAGRTVAIYRSPQDTFHATDGICTHERAILADGLVMGDIIECPKHNGRFNYKTGEATRIPARANLCTYPVKVASRPGLRQARLDRRAAAAQPHREHQPVAQAPPGPRSSPQFGTGALGGRTVRVIDGVLHPRGRRRGDFGEDPAALLRPRVERRGIGAAGDHGGRASIRAKASNRPPVRPKPPVGFVACAASPASRTRPFRICSTLRWCSR